MASESESKFSFELPTDLIDFADECTTSKSSNNDDHDEVFHHLTALLNDLSAFPTLEFEMDKGGLQVVLTLYKNSKMRCRMALGPNQVAVLRQAAAAVDETDEESNEAFLALLKQSLGIPEEEKDDIGVKEVVEDLCLEAAVLDFLHAYPQTSSIPTHAANTTNT